MSKKKPRVEAVGAGLAGGAEREVEVRGVRVRVRLADLEDVRFTYALGKVADDAVDDAEKLTWYARMLDVLFGGEAYSIMCRLADDGPLDAAAWSDFYMGVLEAVGAKN